MHNILLCVVLFIYKLKPELSRWLSSRMTIGHPRSMPYPLVILSPSPPHRRATAATSTTVVEPKSAMFDVSIRFPQPPPRRSESALNPMDLRLQVIALMECCSRSRLQLRLMCVFAMMSLLDHGAHGLLRPAGAIIHDDNTSQIMITTVSWV